MPKVDRSALAAIGILAGVAAGAAPAAAHPHGWIDVAVEVVFDPSGKVTGLRQTWLFDEYYTAYATEGFDSNRDGRPDQDKLDALLAENLRNLAAYDTFTHLTAGATKVAVAKPVEAASRMNGNRLEMAFKLPLKAPVAADAGIEYAIYDPTFYIEILHREGGKSVRLIGAPAGCTHRLIAPSPTIETVALAQALDRGQSAGDGLGAQFAERVEIRCGP